MCKQTFLASVCSEKKSQEKRRNCLKQDLNWWLHLAWLGRPRPKPTDHLDSSIVVAILF